MSDIESQIQKLTQEQETKREQIRQMEAEAIAEVKAKGLYSFTMPDEYNKLVEEEFDLDDQIWGLRDPNTQILQLCICHIRESIKAHTDMLKKLESIGLGSGIEIYDTCVEHIKTEKERLATLEKQKRNH